MSSKISPKRGHRFAHFHLSSFLCCGSLAEHRGESSKPISVQTQVPQQPDKPSSLPDISLPKGSSCSFFERLPIELRLHIYEYALGGQTIHLVHNRNDSVEWPFQTTSPMITSMIGANWDPLRANPWEAPQINLALLLTCRRIYNEAADILYNSNFFTTDNIRVFIYLAKNCLSPQRLLAIKHLDVSVTWRFFPLLSHYTDRRDVSEGFYDSATWQQFWHIVANEMKLSSLSIDFQNFSAYGALDEEWVKPILEVKDIQNPSVTFMPTGLIYPERAETFRQGLVFSLSSKRDGGGSRSKI